ncbi:hypothetical protein HanRHA438_Chr15g0721001 [Helianthus annuus]|uniref:Uncharacterized protein n=1 Tax=Helianthus annuus TaxID=4232 RepID=A0A9K3H498_HELAN|nr:hypothetical protein HanXRQr2_Chr15g0708831 [Helianthus annuus]KAJ0457189.1 hypothetical protein HanIR_Chr15g0770941 [Helianthus annuus]KAJ0474247.1 hypothetical protein HanHA89_Chr15g0627501 [Helianthus annuus]KAJ0649817.1 hypothetical protein HanLR1_Chr15g0588581 [Helianthus annuus]KAJ0653598.1 hypothetical protein HanOQP8_Chr15g0585341 [Helianthus annuus]
MVLMVMGSLLGFRAISPLLMICSINATEKSHYIFLAFIRFSIRLSGCFGFSGASGDDRWLGLQGGKRPCVDQPSETADDDAAFEYTNGLDPEYPVSLLKWRIHQLVPKLKIICRQQILKFTDPLGCKDTY